MKTVCRALFRLCGLLLIGFILLLPLESRAQTLPRPRHVVIVIEENHSYGQIVGSAKAPYMNSLAAQGASFSAFYALHHPSQPTTTWNSSRETHRASRTTAASVAPRRGGGVVVGYYLRHAAVEARALTLQ
jgi:hypothetical protein